MRFVFYLPLLLALSAVWPAGATAETRRDIPGPVLATVVRFIDGDTLVADAHVWPGQTIRVAVRIRGIDAPEMRSRCDGERAAAERARDALAGLIGGKAIAIANIGGGKYYGRVLADVFTHEGRDVVPALIERGLVRSYDGGRRASRCVQK